MAVPGKCKKCGAKRLMWFGYKMSARKGRVHQAQCQKCGYIGPPMTGRAKSKKSA